MCYMVSMVTCDTHLRVTGSGAVTHLELINEQN